jgi:hypothetical protein
MPLRPDWEAEFPNNNLQRARFVRPHCEIPSTFQSVVVTVEMNRFGGRNSLR